MKYLVIKRSNNKFEQIVNEWFKKSCCDVIPKEYLISETHPILGMPRLIKYMFFRDCSQYEKVIIFDSLILYTVSVLFKKGNYILWLWNTIPRNSYKTILIKIINKIGNIYTFDEKDAKEYKLNLNTQFYYKEKNIYKQIMYDIYFVGLNKDRYREILEFSKICDQYNITYKFQIVDDNIENESKFIEHNFIDYSVVLDFISRTKAILDISKTEQIGLTLRAMEGLFYNKKIITTNNNYKAYNFYNKSNTFIIGEDRNIKKFIESKCWYDSKCVDYYSIDNWIKRFR